MQLFQHQVSTDANHPAVDRTHFPLLRGVEMPFFVSYRFIACDSLKSFPFISATSPQCSEICTQGGVLHHEFEAMQSLLRHYLNLTML